MLEETRCKELYWANCFEEATWKCRS